MKALKFRDLNVEDRLRLFFEGALEHPPALERELEFFLQALERHAGPWMPDLVEGKRRRKYSREAVWKALVESRDAYGSIIEFRRTEEPALLLTLALRSSREPPVLDISLDVQPLSFFAE